MYRRFFVSLLLAFATLAVAATAQAQGQALTGAGPVRNGIAYTGPGDIVSGATAWYGLRAYSRAVAATGTQSAVDLRRSSDSATCTAKIGVNGNIDLTVGTPCAGSTVTSFCNATSCFVSKWYDQSGNTRDASQATAANQPQLFLSGGSNNLPYLESTTTNQLLQAASFTPATGVVSFSLVANRSAGTNSLGIIRQNGLNNRLNTSIANRWTLQGGAGGTVTIIANDVAWHSANVVMNGASSVANIDGTETTGTATGNTTAGVPQTLIGVTGTTIDIPEVGFYDNVALSAGQRSALQANMKAYWGTP